MSRQAIHLLHSSHHGISFGHTACATEPYHFERTLSCNTIVKCVIYSSPYLPPSFQYLRESGLLHSSHLPPLLHRLSQYAALDRNTHPLPFKPILRPRRNIPRPPLRSSPRRNSNTPPNPRLHFIRFPLLGPRRHLPHITHPFRRFLWVLRRRL
ncbi:hypothetical protein BDZ45DRAFT_214629 [Acephala macrosclerotiorum]|nr:hypothetical protein BDZ45DRAFT_214629 [Acephala macrosclerotiorum]